MAVQKSTRYDALSKQIGAKICVEKGNLRQRLKVAVQSVNVKNSCYILFVNIFDCAVCNIVLFHICA